MTTPTSAGGSEGDRPAVAMELRGTDQGPRTTGDSDPERRSTAEQMERLAGVAVWHSEVLVRRRALPPMIVGLGSVLLVFWSLANLIPGLGPTQAETIGGLVIGCVLLISGGALALLSDHITRRAIDESMNALSEADQKLAAKRNRLEAESAAREADRERRR